MKRKLRILSVFLIFTYVTLIPQQAKANAFVMPALNTGFYSSIGEGATALAEIAGPYALPILAGAVAAGVAYQNRNQIATFAKGALNYLESVGQGVGKGIMDMGDGVSVMTSGAKTALMNYIQSIKSSPTSFKVPLVTTMSAPANTTTWLSLYVPVSTATNLKIQMMQTGSFGIDNLSFMYRVDAYPSTWMGGSNDSICWDVSGLRVGNNLLQLPTYGNLQIGIRNVGSFPIDVGIVQNMFPDKSICANVGTTYLDDTFAKPDTAVKTSPATTALTWDDVIGLTNTDLKTKINVTDTSVPTDVPGTGTGNPIDTTLPDSTKTLDFTPLQTVGISNKFPFCIPFDLYNSIKTLNVSPKAPKWTINFDSRYFKGGGSIDIDFSIFEQWAVVIRWGVLFMFTISLIILTRRVIGGGN